MTPTEGQTNTRTPRAADVRTSAVRESIDSMLLECTEKQVAFFHRIHDLAPYKGWANCPADRIDASHDLIARTVDENRKSTGAKTP